MGELAAERGDLVTDHISGDELRQTMADFDAVWASMTTREQEKMIRLLVGKVGYDGRTGQYTYHRYMIWGDPAGIRSGRTDSL